MSQLTTRQQQVYDFLVEHISTNGYPPTLREIAGHLHVSGNLGVLRHLEALERKELISRSPGSSRSIVLNDQLKNDAATLPLVGTVRAGQPQLADEVVEAYLAVDRSLVKGQDSFLLRVKGNSMIEAHIMPGDLVVVRPQATAENGEIVVALIEGEATLKRFYREREEIRLKPDNSSMKALIYREGDADVQIIGKVTGLCRSLGGS